jgi:hypothetical protein
MFLQEVNVMKRYVLPFVPLLVFLLALSRVPVASAAPGPWWADYFANPNLEGAPALSREDAVIGFEWGTGSPNPALPADNFSVRWTREEWFAGGTYRFLARTDDGVRIWVGGELVLDEWHDRQDLWTSSERYVPEGVHTVVVEYFEHTGAAVAEVGWEKLVGGAAWRGAYFANQNLQGDPVLTRDDTAIDFDWGTGSPAGAVPADQFSVRWIRTLGFTGGTYRFLASCDDGVRVLVDDQLVIDAWRKQALPNTRTGQVTLSEGQHVVTVEYFEEGGEASAHVWWELRDAVSGWEGRYFDNPDLVGGPALVRDDAAIDFDWGVGPPVDWMPDDNFAIRWTRTVDFTPGYYIFKLRSDDGLRFWLDGELLIDKWHDMEAQLHYFDTAYLEGPHQLLVEYYEHTGRAQVAFWWEPSTAYGVMPRADDPTLDPWHTEFFANPDLQGDPTFIRIDEALDYDWGTGAPVDSVPPDGFSVRWTQPLYFDASTYRFTVTTDGGVRLWVDDRLLIDAWYPAHGSRSAATWLTAGVHRIRMEYFDDGGAALARLRWAKVAGGGGGAATSPPAERISLAAARLAAELDRSWHDEMPHRPRGLQPW